MKKVLIAILIFLSCFGVSYSNESNIDFSKMTTKEIMEFYKKNPEYGKNRIQINYDDYRKGDYVVLRGEYIDAKDSPIKNKSVIFQLGSQKYYYTTSQNGVFNLEAKKDDIKEKRIYNMSINLDNQIVNFRVTGKTLLDKSIFHFQVEKEILEGKEVLNIKNIHNNIFGENTFKIKEKTVIVPSVIGIQGKWVIIITLLVLGFFSFFYCLYKKENYSNI